jgi:FlaA1/EpsC-like NDP-sugar epimerase
MSSISITQTTKPQDWISRRTAGYVARIGAKLWSEHRSALVLSCESMLAVVSFLAAVFVVSETQEHGWATNAIRTTLVFLISFRVVALLSAKLYRRSLRYACIPDIISIAKIAFLSSLFFWTFVWWQFPELRLPAALFLFDWMFLQAMWGGFHFAMRIFRAQQTVQHKGRKRVLVVGAGNAGMTLLKELMTDPGSRCEPVAVVDDDTGKCDRSMYGVPVMSGTKNVARIAAEMRAQEIFVCIPSAAAGQMYEILASCRKSQLPVRTLPTLAELTDEKFSGWQALSPTIAQLMEKQDVPIDLAETRRTVGGKVVLVTGAGGSIGSELCRQIA